MISDKKSLERRNWLGRAGLQASVNAAPKDRGASAPEHLAPAEAGLGLNSNAERGPEGPHYPDPNV
jgi:hypothetical protein